MRTERIDLLIGNAGGATMKIPMRFNASHQRGYRCFIGPLADLPEQIMENTPPSFHGRRLFDALAEYRKSIEPAGWYLLHAVARRDCWPRPDEIGPFVQQLRPGLEQSERVRGFDRAELAEVGTLAEQQASFEEWMNSLEPVYAPRVPPRSGHEHDEPIVDSVRLRGLQENIWSPTSRTSSEFFEDPSEPSGGNADAPRPASSYRPLRTINEIGTMAPMARYLKKQVAVEAVQWFKHGDHPAVHRESDKDATGYIDTPEGRLTVAPGDWVITGIAGENYPCKPDIFEKLYSPDG